MGILKKYVKAWLPENVVDKLIFLKGKMGASPYFHYNDQFKAIFIHIPKAAGTSVYTSLFGEVKRNHIRLLYFEAYDASKFKRYFKFAIVRNPYDRLVSSYFYIKNKNDLYTPMLEKYPTFSSFVKALKNSATKVELFKIPHFNSQFYFLADRHGKVGVDFIGHFENLENDYKVIASKLGISTKLDHHNKSKHKPYSEYFDSELIRIVNEVYNDDFTHLGYDRIAP